MICKNNCFKLFCGLNIFLNIFKYNLVLLSEYKQVPCNYQCDISFIKT